MRWVLSLKNQRNSEDSSPRVCRQKKKIVQQKKKTFDTQDSRVVPHRSTDWAQPCLTSQFGWDAVYPRWYDRMMGHVVFSSMLPLH